MSRAGTFTYEAVLPVTGAPAGTIALLGLAFVGLGIVFVRIGHRARNATPAG